MIKTITTNNQPYCGILVAFFIGYLLMPFVSWIAIRYNLVVIPNKRTSHEGKISFLGGLDIFLSFLITILIFYNRPSIAGLGYSFVGLCIVFVVGFLDDLFTLKASQKLLGEIVSGLCLIILADVRILSLHGFLGIYTLDIWTSYFVSIFFFIALINAINLVDGIDGLASGLSIVYTLFFGIYFQIIDQMSLAFIAYVLSGSLMIFFPYNVFSKRRKQFLGDSGSLILGYMIVFFSIKMFEMNAIGVVEPTYKMSAAPTVIFSLLIVPLFDTLRVMFTRMKKGISPFVADRNHVHHLMLSLGLSHIQVTFILISITICFLLLALLCRNIPNELLLLVDFFLCFLLTKYLWKKVDEKKGLDTNQTKKIDQ